MGTVTKVMFGLIILAGGGGIFMSLSMIPGKIDALKEAQKMAGDNAAAAGKLAQAQKERADGLESDLSLKVENLNKIKNDAKDFEEKYNTVMQGKGDAQGLIDAANAANAQAARDKTAADTKYESARTQNTVLGEENARLSKYKTIKFNDKENLSVTEIQAHLADLEARIKKDTPTIKIPKTEPRKKVAVENVDKSYGYITIPAANKSAKKGDRYLVARGGEDMGVIIVNAIKNGKLYCIIDRAKTPFLNIDNKVGDIRVGDTVVPE